VSSAKGGRSALQPTSTNTSLMKLVFTESDEWLVFVPLLQ